MSDVRDEQTDQPLPKPGQVAIHQHVIDSLHRYRLDEAVKAELAEGLRSREELGERKYGRKLESHNGRDPGLDLWQESLDALVYADQMFVEKHPLGGILLARALSLAAEVALLRVKER